MNKKHVNIISIVLFAIGISFALLILTDYLNNPLPPKLLGKDEALSIATQAGKWNKDLLGDKTIDTKLLHIKNDGFAFSVDEKTLRDTTLVPNRFNDLTEDQYVWLVQISLVGGSNREWDYLIDASNGILLNPKQNITTLEPTDPQVSVKEGTLIHQASGDVIIVFPVGISKGEPQQSPFPAQLVVTQGDTVTWRNDDTQAHTVISGFLQQPEFIGQVFDSGIIAAGDSFSHTFSDKSITSYYYFCAIHPWMTGEVLVQHPEDESTSTIESFNKKYDAVIKGKIEMFMGHKEAYPVIYQSNVEIITVYKTHPALANEKTVTILAERNMVTEPGATAIMGLDYDKVENYFRLVDRLVMEADG